MTIGSQMPELDRGTLFAPPPYKIGSQNTQYKLRLVNSNTFFQEVVFIAITLFFVNYNRVQWILFSITIET